MTTVYLFRIDPANDNDDYFAAVRSSAAHVYAGTNFCVGKRWTPDLVKVVVEDQPDRCGITLIELEPTESRASISCRKYLSEDSEAIVRTFKDYLNRVIDQCRSTADSREAVFAGLKTTLEVATQVKITTAGALRSATSFVEELLLTDQPRQGAKTPSAIVEPPELPRVFRNTEHLSPDEVKWLARCLIILDAVISHRDQSDADFKNWRLKSPLKRLLGRREVLYPVLRSFAFKTENRGLSLDFEKVLEEIAELWSSYHNCEFSSEKLRRLIEGYFPIAKSIGSHDRMRDVFDGARSYVEEAR